MSFFKLYVVENEDECYIERYETKDGQVVDFNKETDVIDISGLRPYIGKIFDRFVNGDLEGTYRLIDVVATPVPAGGSDEVLYDGEEDIIVDALIFDVV